jgi:hypothetical protein
MEPADRPAADGFLLLSARGTYCVEFGIENRAELDTIFGGAVASCCYQADAMTVRDTAPESGANPAR